MAPGDHKFGMVCGDTFYHEIGPRPSKEQYMALLQEPTPRFVLFPGWVVSRNDSQRHWINEPQLRYLYGIPRSARCVTATSRWTPQPGDIECRPRYDGDYPIFETKLATVSADEIPQTSRAENFVEAKRDDSESFAVLVRSCIVTNAVDTMLFSDAEMAKVYCKARWRIPLDDWESYLAVKAVGSGWHPAVKRTEWYGWKHEKDETETIYIHIERRVVEF